MRLRTQLTFAFGSVITSALVLAVMSHFTQQMLLHAVNRAEQTQQQYRHLSELALGTSGFFKEIADNLLFGELDELTEAQMDAAEAQFLTNLDALESTSRIERDTAGEGNRARGEEELEGVANLRLLLERLHALNQRLSDAVERGDVEEAKALFENELEQLYDVEIRSALGSALESEGKELEEAQAAAIASAARHRLVSVVWTGTCILLCAFVGVVFTRSLTRRVNDLVKGTRRFAAGDLAYRVPEEGQDEIRDLAQRFNEMAAELANQRAALEAAHQALVSAWEAGVNEVAGGVLHNIGNVLNSINVSVGVLREAIDDTAQRDDLQAILETAGTQPEDWVRFLTTDERGAALPTFLAALASTSATEHKTLRDELGSLTEHLEHVRNILNIQKHYAHARDVEEDVSVTSLVDDALQMCGGIGEREGIQLVREERDVPRIAVERHKVLQILLNLLRNAKDSVREHASARPCITVDVAATADGGARVSVTDNGSGLTPDAMRRVFDFGYTSKQDGQGIGLHNCRLAAKVIGAELAVSSPGPGKGATFSLTLPSRPPGVAQKERPHAG